MKIHATLEIYLLSHNGRVNYYTVRLHDDGVPDDQTEVEKFFNNIEDRGLEDESRLMITLLKTLGYKGVRKDVGRNEGAFNAFWPKKQFNLIFRDLTLKDIEPVRLYFYRIDDFNVILFGGDLKSINGSAQDCPNVAKHFKLAKMITELLEREFEHDNIDSSNLEIVLTALELKIL